MFRDVALYRNLLTYGLVFPLALVLGYLLATPTDMESIAILGMVLAVISFPLVMKFHHAFLIIAWNASLIVFFLPGKPSLMMILAAISLGFWLVNVMMRRNRESYDVPVVRNALIFLGIVMLVTAYFTKGIGGRAFGGEIWGGKRYWWTMAAIFGYFALVSRPMSKKAAIYLVPLFIASGVTAIGSDIAYAAGPAFYFLFLFFPVELAASQVITESSMYRLTGVAFASTALIYTMLMVYGIKGIFDLRRFWRLLVFSCLFGLSLFGGYRSILILAVMVMAVQFLYERLYKTFIFPVLIGIFLVAGVFTVVFVDKLPLSIQRTLSFLPLEVHPMAKADAMGTLDWRLQMWKVVMPEVPKYLLMGKGYGYDGTDYFLTQESIRRGFYTAYEDTMVSGNYHNGILTVIIPFGIWGMAGFLWFAGAGLWVLVRNYRYGDPDLARYNTFLLAYFVARLCFYLTLYGQFDLDFMVFTGIVGLSISLNHGVRKPVNLADETEPVAVVETAPTDSQKGSVMPA